MAVNNITSYLRDRGFNQTTDIMTTHIETWKSWYQGQVDSFHNYKVWNGTNFIARRMSSMQLAKSGAETWSNLLFNEKCQIVIEDEVTNEFVKQVFDDNNFWVKINESQELKAALGTVCYIPYAKGAIVTSDGGVSTAERIAMNFITAENIKPLSWENGVIRELATTSVHTVGKDEYIFLQMFLIGTNGNYITENHLFKNGTGSFTEVDNIASVEGFEYIPAVINTGSPLKPFIIDRLNISNNIDNDNPMGVSVFANAIDTMMFCDTVFDSFRNEFVLGKKRIMVTTEAMKIGDGEATFDPKDVAFYALPGDKLTETGPFVKELDMKLRTEEHEKALQQGLNIFSSQLGLGENYFKYDREGGATATQIVSENNTMFRTLKKHEIILDAVLVDLIRLIISIGKNIMRQPLVEDTPITIQFDDSIIESKDADMARWQQWVSAGLVSKVEWRMKWMGETEEDAAAAIAKVNSTMEPGLYSNSEFG